MIYATGVFYLNMVAAVVGCVCVSRQFSGGKKNMCNKFIINEFHKSLEEFFISLIICAVSFKASLLNSSCVRCGSGFCGFVLLA